MIALRGGSSGWHIEIDGRPTLVLGGELHNSSATHRDFLRAALDESIESGITTVLAPVTWEQVEPQEDRFDLESVRVLSEEVHRRGLRLIPLWFGAWKNGRSTYAPDWVLGDRTRFPVAEGRVSHVPTLSLFGGDLLESERRAYLTVLTALADGPATVVAVQVDNEVGLLGDSRDRSALATEAFEQAVPGELLDALRRPGTHSELLDAWTGQDGSWARAFGDSDDTDARFMAWHYAKHVDRLARDGRRVLDVPVMVNAWLDSELVVPGAPAGGTRPGEYPSGGPLPQVALVWRTAAPAVDLLSPDIYLGDASEIMARYTSDGSPLMIPETVAGQLGAARAFLAIGRYGAIGMAPFGIDQTDPDDKVAIRWAYERLDELTPWIVEARTRSATTGFLLDVEAPEHRWTCQGVRYRVRPVRLLGRTVDEFAFGLLLVRPDGQVVAAGSGFTVVAEEAESGEPLVVRECGEGHVDGGEWRVSRYLNGDETLHGELIYLPPFALDLRTIVAAPGQNPLRGDQRTTGIRAARFIRYASLSSG